MLRHKRVLIAVRLVFLVLLGSLALAEYRKGALSPVLGVLLAAYALTTLAMIPEKGTVFSRQRVQAGMLIFDIAVLVAALALIEEHRQELFLGTFLVVLLASAGRRLTVSIGGFIAVAAFYAWFTLRDGDAGRAEAVNRLSTGLPVLFVVAIYVGYVTEAVAGEQSRRREVEDRLRRELQGMNRFHELASSMMLETAPERVFQFVLDGARSLLEAHLGAVFWRPTSEDAPAPLRSPGFTDALAARCPVGRVMDEKKPLRLPGDGDVSDLILAPFVDPRSGLEGCLVVGWTAPRFPLEAEVEAVQLLIRQACLSLENAGLCQTLAHTRDVWEAAFQSIPTPVVIVDAGSNILQFNQAFLRLGGFDLVMLMGSPLSAVLEGASDPSGSPFAPARGGTQTFDAVRLVIPKLGGEFDVTRGPYGGGAGGGAVWVFRRTPEK